MNMTTTRRDQILALAKLLEDAETVAAIQRLIEYTRKNPLTPVTRGQHASHH